MNNHPTCHHYCITGGIGAGKSFVCNIMRQQGIDIYDCDSAAKRLMNNDPQLRRQLTQLIGHDTYTAEGMLNKATVASFLLGSEANKQRLNAIVHPAVIADYYQSGLTWMESAIIYEAHLEQYVDRIVAVTAPAEVRIKRIMHRDSLTYDRAAEWISKQADQEEVARRADFVIVNDGITDLLPQVERMITLFT